MYKKNSENQKETNGDDHSDRVLWRYTLLKETNKNFLWDPYPEKSDSF